jgi:hypothetical protein
MRLPKLGKYKGYPLADIPQDYLEWLRDTVELREPLATAIEREWERREYGFDPEDNDPEEDEPEEDYQPTPDLLASLNPEEQALLQELIQAGFRALALRYHPDQGGNATACASLTRSWKNCA